MKETMGDNLIAKKREISFHSDAWSWKKSLRKQHLREAGPSGEDYSLQKGSLESIKRRNNVLVFSFPFTLTSRGSFSLAESLPCPALKAS